MCFKINNMKYNDEAYALLTLTCTVHIGRMPLLRAMMYRFAYEVS